MSPYDKAFIDPIRRQGHGSWFRTLAVPWGAIEFTSLKSTRSNAVNLAARHVSPVAPTECKPTAGRRIVWRCLRATR